MQIGELSKLTGFSRDTIRWYEKIGLLKTNKRNRGENNYRVYDEKTAERLRSIKQAKSFGFTLKEIDDLLFLSEEELLNCTAASPILEERLQKIREKIRELQVLEGKLVTAKNSCEGDCREMLWVKHS